MAESTRFTCGTTAVPLQDMSRLERADHIRVARRNDLKNLRQLFELVVRCYLENRSLPCLSAINVDMDATSRSRVWTAATAHHAVDIENANRDAMAGRPDLEQAWFAMAAGEQVPKDVAEQVVIRCGKLYRARDLEPAIYFRPGIHRATGAGK